MFAANAETASARVGTGSGPQSSNDLVCADKLGELEEPGKRGGGVGIDFHSRRKRPYGSSSLAASGCGWLERICGNFAGRAIPAKQSHDSIGPSLDDDRTIPNK